MLSSDPIGQAVHNFHFKRINKPVTIYADGFDPDYVQPSYFFRSFEQMPQIEQLALQKARGHVLDVGACAGCHSIYLQNKGIEVTALERSALCCGVLKDRNIQNVIHSDLYNLHSPTFDTILLLMNGTGIAGTLHGFNNFLKHLKKLLKPDGQILIDSSDLIYLYMDEDGSALVDLNSENYYGELVYQTEYNGQKGTEFPWLYLDPENLKEHAKQCGLKIEKGDHFDFLATIKHA
ncbi:methyltransferase domain-containing protein [Mangrovibacterium sp.]|uniref:methyltransferase domain-containing protein n=1 Tax=Mangrovibacterium sp. TaxID=1961364 RepID=UPI003563272A